MKLRSINSNHKSQLMNFLSINHLSKRELECQIQETVRTALIIGILDSFLVFFLSFQE